MLRKICVILRHEKISWASRLLFHEIIKEKRMGKKDKKKLSKQRKRLGANVVSLVAVFLMMCAAAMVQSGRLLGHPMKGIGEVEAVPTMSGDTVIVNTTETGAEIGGYAGPVPLEIRIVKGRIDSVAALDNAETPGFFKRVVKSGLLDSWNGMTPREAIDAHVDAVSGATYSSNAVIGNVRAGMEEIVDDGSVASEEETATETAVNQNPDSSDSPDAKFYIAMIVVLAAMSLPLVWKNRKYRVVQQILNAGVLGFWAGTFVDYIVMLRLLSSGSIDLMAIPALLMLIAAFIYPLLGKDGYYCAWVCPLGSIQELAGRCNPRHHLHMGQKTVKVLTRVRMLLWGCLMVLLWTGMFTSWIDYELFSAFLLTSASTGVIIGGCTVVVISLFIPRPYCRFVCPTGTLMRMSQNIDTK